VDGSASKRKEPPRGTGEMRLEYAFEFEQRLVARRDKFKVGRAYAAFLEAILDGTPGK